MEELRPSTHPSLHNLRTRFINIDEYILAKPNVENSKIPTTNRVNNNNNIT